MVWKSRGLENISLNKNISIYYHHWNWSFMKYQSKILTTEKHMTEDLTCVICNKYFESTDAVQLHMKVSRCQSRDI